MSTAMLHFSNVLSFILAICNILSAAITQCAVAAFSQLGVAAVAAFTQCAVAAFTQSNVAAVAVFTQCNVVAVTQCGVAAFTQTDAAAGTSEHIRPRGVDPATVAVQALVSRIRPGCCKLSEGLLPAGKDHH